MILFMFSYLKRVCILLLFNELGMNVYLVFMALTDEFLICFGWALIWFSSWSIWMMGVETVNLFYFFGVLGLGIIFFLVLIHSYMQFGLRYLTVPDQLILAISYFSKFLSKVVQSYCQFWNLWCKREKNGWRPSDFRVFNPWILSLDVFLYWSYELWTSERLLNQDLHEVLGRAII